MPRPGEGKVDCTVIAGRVHQTLSSAYPLKLLSPEAVHNPDTRLIPAVSYILSYGGGIVHGDQIHVDATAGSGSALLLLTQGSTKVYRQRPGRPPSYLKNPKNDSKFDIHQTYQTLVVDVQANAMVCLLPDPVTCFEHAKYNQRQVVRMADASASLVLLDWVTSGRMSRGERWVFDKYLSVNAVLVGGKLVIRDALLLEDARALSKDRETSSFKRRLADIDVFAYLLVLGPEVAKIAKVFRDEHAEHRIKPFRPNARAVDAEETDIRWSVSEVAEHGLEGVAVRVAGPSTEAVKWWIKKRIGGLQSVVGDSAWSMYYNA
ncbi:hypothetical protein FBU59_003594 [Linderina macrospora]|uniref:Uncharacterized protein n=1 Tax=Linderina macrospora TaxID=4868 RepID=A0ACC1J821_9FUNG|nr:hypothetical protein FBU59_003594 [Linderina macrospora]